METLNDGMKRLSGHPEPKELEAHYDEPVEAAPVKKTRRRAAATADIDEVRVGSAGWGFLGLLGAMLLVAAVFCVAEFDRNHRKANAGEMAYQEISVVEVNGVGDGSAIAQASDAGTASAQAATTTSGKATATATPAVTDAVCLFPTNGSDVADNPDLDAIAKAAVATGADVTVEGYTDESGRLAYNQQLSKDRAEAVGEYLVEHGVPANHIVVKGCGPTHEFASAALDRRVEVHLHS